MDEIVANARMEMLKSQRNEALDTIVALYGQIANLKALHVKALKDLEDEVQKHFKTKEMLDDAQDYLAKANTRISELEGVDATEMMAKEISEMIAEDLDYFKEGEDT